MSPKIAVVGQGVMGLTSAIRLHEQNFDVIIFSKDSFERANSMAAGAW